MLLFNGFLNKDITYVLDTGEAMLSLKEVRVKLGNKTIVNGVSMNLNSGEINVIMGPNGSGKSTLCKAIMGHPEYRVSGTIIFDGKEIQNMEVNVRAQNGIFMSFQEPPPVDGVTVMKLISKFDKQTDLLKLSNDIKENAKKLGLGGEFLTRSLNIGFSGGEKKRSELLQLIHKQPKLAMLDEIDSGIDIDGFKVLKEILAGLKKKGSTILLITHQTRMLHHISPDKIFIMKNGKVAASGGIELIDKIEKNGYDWLN